MLSGGMTYRQRTVACEHAANKMPEQSYPNRVSGVINDADAPWLDRLGSVINQGEALSMVEALTGIAVTDDDERLFVQTIKRYPHNNFMFVIRQGAIRLIVKGGGMEVPFMSQADCESRGLNITT